MSTNATDGLSDDVRCSIEEEELSDGAVAYNVIIWDADLNEITVRAPTAEAALAVYNALLKCDVTGA